MGPDIVVVEPCVVAQVDARRSEDAEQELALCAGNVVAAAALSSESRRSTAHDARRHDRSDCRFAHDDGHPACQAVAAFCGIVMCHGLDLSTTGGAQVPVARPSSGP